MHNNRFYYPMIVLCLALTALLSSCVYEDEKPCPCEVRFVYNYNMEFADAFPSQVNWVKLFIYDDRGRFVSTVEDHITRHDGNYSLPLRLQAGTYTLVAWAGTDNTPSCYNISPQQPTTENSIGQLQLNLKLGDTQTVYDKSPEDLWHGITEHFTVSETAPSRAVVPLVKDVNRFKVLIQSADDKPLTANDYSLAIKAANHTYDYRNNLADCPTLEYRPYSMKEAVIDNQTAPTNSALLAEMATLRLTTDKASRFVVHNQKTNQDVFNIDLVKYLEMMRLDKYKDMSLQEYLDRENNYQIILLIGRDRNNAEVVLSLQINRWRIVFNDNDL